jgi:hypothetical protein
MRTHTAKAWSAVAIVSFILGDGQVIQPIRLTTCVGLPPRTHRGGASIQRADVWRQHDGTLISNGDFSGGTSGWTVSSTMPNSVSSGVFVYD